MRFAAFVFLSAISLATAASAQQAAAPAADQKVAPAAAVPAPAQAPAAAATTATSAPAPAPAVAPSLPGDGVPIIDYQTETIRAPFQDPPLAKGGLRDLYVGPQNAETLEVTDTRALDVPHRTVAQLDAWLINIVPQALTFNLTDMNKQYAEATKLFTAPGLVAYRDYLAQSGLVTDMKARNLRVDSVSTDKPQLLNQGVASGSYKWLFDVPIIMSFIPNDTESLRRIAKPETRKLVVRVQLTRVPAKEVLTAENTQDVGIEIWQVQARR
jgi:hypothetical protein